MSDIIVFLPAKRPGRAVSGDGGAQILFFTGVRYQRISEDAPLATAHAPATRRQDGGGRAVRKGKRRRRA